MTINGNDKRRVATIALFGVGVTAASALPIPFADGIVKRAVHRQFIRTVAKHYDVQLDGSAVDILSDDVERPKSGGAKFATAALWMVSKKYLRNLTIVLAVRNTASVLTDFAARGYLVDVAMERGHVGAVGGPTVPQVREAIDRSCDAYGTDPAELVWRQAKRLAAAIRKESEPEPETLTKTYLSTLEGVRDPKERTPLAASNGAQKVDVGFDAVAFAG